MTQHSEFRRGHQRQKTGLYPKSVEWPLGYPASVLEAYKGIIEGCAQARRISSPRSEVVGSDMRRQGSRGPKPGGTDDCLAARGHLDTTKDTVRRSAEARMSPAHDVRTMFTFEDSRVIAAACRVVLDQIYAVR